MILTTTPSIEGRTITQYKGVVFGEVVAGVNFLRDFAARIRIFVGGRRPLRVLLGCMKETSGKYSFPPSGVMAP